MIIINDDAYILDPTEVSTVTVMSMKIIVGFKGRDTGYSVPSDNPKEDARRLVELLSIDIKAGGMSDPRAFNTQPPAF